MVRQGRESRPDLGSRVGAAPLLQSVCGESSAESASTLLHVCVCVCAERWFDCTQHPHPTNGRPAPTFPYGRADRALTVSILLMFLQGKHMRLHPSQLPLKRNLTHHCDKSDE